MPFIGIFAKENDSNFIKNEIYKNSKINKFEVFNINQKSLENLKNVKFDILVIKEDITKMIKKSNNLENLIKKATYIIINKDVKNNNLLIEYGFNTITYGFNTNSDITISSIKEENVMICIQNKIKDINDKMIEEQEIVIKVKKHNINKLYNIMVIFTVFSLYGERLKNN